MLKKLIIFLMAGVLLLSANGIYAAEEIRFDFEGSDEKWAIPDWAYYQGDHKARSTNISTEEASTGESSLEVVCDFPGDVWAAALVEFQNDMDFSQYETISADVFIPKKAPRGLLVARFILTVSDGWLFTEMREAVPLKRGKWVTVSARLDKREEDVSQWKGRKHKRLYLHIDKIKKIAVRVEYDVAPPHRLGPRYEGSIYIDNIVVK